jgi:hypothetical protein
MMNNQPSTTELVVWPEPTATHALPTQEPADWSDFHSTKSDWSDLR